jgi:hypothetical protein
MVCQLAVLCYCYPVIYLFGIELLMVIENKLTV